MHWQLVSADSVWPARQGHAAAYYRGSILVLGGFDASGYSNIMYGLPLEAAAIPGKLFSY